MLYVCVHECLYVHPTCAGARRGFGSPETGLIDGCELGVPETEPQCSESAARAEPSL